MRQNYAVKGIFGVSTQSANSEELSDPDKAKSQPELENSDTQALKDSASFQMCGEDCPECTDQTCAMHAEWKSELESGEALSNTKEKKSTVNSNTDHSKPSQT